MKFEWFLILIVLFLGLIGFAQQGNYKFNNFGNTSILLSGNVTGSVTDIGLTYYNPARLTEVENTGFAFNILKIKLIKTNSSHRQSCYFN